MGVGKRIQDLLELKGMTRKELAEKSGVSEAALSRYINGSRQPKMISLSAIANVLGVSTDELLGNTINDPAEVDEAIILIARNAESMTREQKLKLIELLIKE